MDHLLLVLLLLWGSGVHCETAKVDLVMLVDESGSISRNDFDKIQTFLVAIVNSLNIGPDAVQIGLTLFSTKARTAWHLNTHQTKHTLLRAIEELERTGGSTKTGKALEHILHNQFKPSVGMRPDSRRIAVLITDGESQDKVLLPSKNLKHNDIEVYAIGVQGARESELKVIASDNDHVYFIKDFKSLNGIIRNITIDLSKGSNNLAVTTVDHLTSSEPIRCIPDQSDAQCETAKADLVILVDESGSITLQDFRIIRSFLKHFVNNLDIGLDRVQIGLTLFSTTPRTMWHLNTHQTKESLLRAIEDLEKGRGSTYTGKALTHILRNQFKPNVGMRPDSKKIAVMITDGASYDDIELPSKNLKDSGIEVFVIGVAKVNVTQLKLINSDQNKIYIVKNFDTLQDIVVELIINFFKSVKSLDSVRLLNGSSLCSGRLQVKSNQRWSSVCEDDFDLQDAEVICRELGCGPPLHLQGALYGEVEAPVWSREFQCGGHESALLDCRSSGSVRSSCSPGKAAGLTCSEPVRLVGGASRCAGTLEVKQGLWRSVEASGWTLMDAAVACRELDCGSAVLTGSRNASWDGPTWKIKPACVKSGSTLRECATSSQSPTVLELICSDLLVQPIISASFSSNDGDSQVQQQESSWVLKGSSFTISCSIQPQYPGGSFQLTFTSSNTTSNYTQPAVNHSAHFLFPAAEPAHQGTYSCVYRVFVFSRNFSSESRQLSLTVSDPTVFVIRLLLLLLSLLLFISAVCFSHKVTGRQEPRPPEDQELDG
ncbi:collagen alpha-1(XII) chain isoform X2 [Oreochromis niloticus]|uniref:collagen alpha-1(XII) chain isoform X2 n=1 Tax=Oreochromis niloticus TaxID=8128 RepID=UPI000904C394|nr:collagen alpha-1(XII) chain isoform X2 [Oreochromis niloticus]